MMNDDVRKPISEKEAPGAPAIVVVNTPAGELTCSEGQVEDLLAGGESTESEEEEDLDESRKPSASKSAKQKSSPAGKSSRK